jgi:integrase
MAFTERQAKAERWEGKDRLVSVGDGLYLNVRRSSKTWVTRHRQAGKWRITTLGRYPEMTTKEARAKALADALARVPSNATVEALAEEYHRDVVEVEHKRPELFRGYLDRAVLPALGSRRAAEVTASEIAAVIRDYSTRGPRTADQLRSVFVALFKFAVEIGVREDNPAAALTRRVAGYRYEPRERVLSDKELRLLWSEVNPNARVLRFQILTGLRIGEAQKGRRDGDFWHVDADLAKNGKAHWVYLPKLAAAQLPLPECTPTNVQAWTRRWCERMKVEPFTPHDCRRTAATRMADAAVEPFVIERVLNHTLQGVLGTYNRGEYRDERIAAAKALEKVIVRAVKPMRKPA